MNLWGMGGSGVEWLTFPALEGIGWLSHGFTTRRGGVGTGPYHSLNMALHVGDDPGVVHENRGLALAALGMDTPSMACGEQTHGVNVAAVLPGMEGRGALYHSDAIPDTDAVATRSVGIPLASFYADCVPVFLVDPVNRAVGLAHAGWKGALGRIAQHTVGFMADSFGSDPGSVLACIGPHIRECCFSVGGDVADAFTHGFGDPPGLLRSGEEGIRLNLELAVKAQLESAGCRASNIHDSGGLCTSCRTDLFFSHRAENGRTGRMASLIQITGGFDFGC